MCGCWYLSFCVVTNVAILMMVLMESNTRWEPRQRKKGSRDACRSMKKKPVPRAPADPDLFVADSKRFLGHHVIRLSRQTDKCFPLQKRYGAVDDK